MFMIQCAFRHVRAAVFFHRYQFVLVTMICNRFADEQRAQNGEDVSLQHRYQQLKTVNENRECYGEQRHAIAGDLTKQVGKNENQGKETQHDQVTRCHVCKQSYEQRERLGEDG